MQTNSYALVHTRIKSGDAGSRDKEQRHCRHTSTNVLKISAHINNYDVIFTLTKDVYIIIII